MTNTQSAVDFPTLARPHIGLTVHALDRAVAFYRALLRQEPTKVRTDYAKFEVLEPPLNLSLVVDTSAPTGTRAHQHLGIQVKHTDEVKAAQARLEADGFETVVEDDVSCCYAVQDKIWASDPDGHRWEVFVVTAADAPGPRENDTGCCAPDCCT